MFIRGFLNHSVYLRLLNPLNFLADTHTQRLAFASHYAV